METIVITAKKMPRDINKFVSKYLKDQGLSVRDTPVQLLVDNEPGRTWIKASGQTSVVAHG